MYLHTIRGYIHRKGEKQRIERFTGGEGREKEKNFGAVVKRERLLGAGKKKKKRDQF